MNAPPDSDRTVTATPEQELTTARRSAGALFPAGYEKLDLVGQGGMGAVWRARDLHLDREVAIKLLHDGIDAESDAGRKFVEEARISAQLQHPGIPAVYAVGTMANGRPFLAMKLIKGRTLADLLTDGTTGPRLGVFEAIAQAVGYAHGRRVIHRDLKPANVMVGAFGEVQVMDWGLAKVLSEASGGPQPPDSAAPAEANIRSQRPGDTETRYGEFMGTPAYMPPEQAIGATDKIDERSDVFGLGGILCVLLTGKPPFSGGDAETTRQMAAQGQLQTAAERLDTCGAEPEVIALAKRCLAADPADRPPNGSAVAAAVATLRAAADERARQAEIAKAAEAVRAAEQRARQRLRTRLAAGIAAALAAGLGLAAWQAKKATDAEAATAEQLLRTQAAERATAEQLAKTNAATAALTVQLGETKKANTETKQALAELEQAIGVVFDVFDGFDIRAVKAGPAPVEAVLARRLIAAGRQLTAATFRDPVALANLQNRLGVTLDNLGFPADAIPLHRAALASRSEHLGPDHTATLASLNNLAEAYRGAGRLDLATPLLERALAAMTAKLGPDHPHTLLSMTGLAAAYRATGRVDKALPLYERALALMTAKLGPDDPRTLLGMNNLAAGYYSAGQLDRALPLLEKALALRKAKLGPDHPDTLASLNNLAEAYRGASQLALATPLLEEARALMTAKLGPGHPDTLTGTSNLALAYRDAGRSDRAVPLLDHVLTVRKATLGPDHPDTIGSTGNLAACLIEAGRGPEAVPHYTDYLAAYRKLAKPNDPGFASRLASVGGDLLAADQYAAAEPPLRECVAIREKIAPDLWNTFNAKSMLGGALLGQRKYAAAEPLLTVGYDGMRQREATIPADGRNNLFEAGTRLIDLYAATNRPEKVAAVRAELPKEIAPRPRAKE
ncbi:serine/threonine-protein kinase [Limnoglobus roseus]|uniref:Tetratricopeptide repeat protein n=1 Tax=Limnoglobus roseus TaxID=2598579 RepID=A0A5C1A911_9BACT|nr:serine/threonine-protein kinase [Limnoglobus roseus]QEL13594.1 tetratricopeptide repeat protein [Limnoglobus roseus]